MWNFLGNRNQIINLELQVSGQLNQQGRGKDADLGTTQFLLSYKAKKEGARNLLNKLTGEGSHARALRLRTKQLLELHKAAQEFTTSEVFLQSRCDPKKTLTEFHLLGLVLCLMFPFAYGLCFIFPFLATIPSRKQKQLCLTLLKKSCEWMLP